MKSTLLFVTLIFAFFCIANAQNYQVTVINGEQSLDPPVLDIQNGTARITHNTNIWFYTFPASGPVAPIPTTQAVHPRPIGWGPYNVTMKSIGNYITLCYIIYEDFADPGYYVEAVTSADGGSTWSPPTSISKVASGSLSLTYDNVLLDRSSSTMYLFYRNQLDTNKIYMANNRGTGPLFSRIALFPSGTTPTPTNMTVKAMTIGMADNLFIVYSGDTSLYMVRMAEPNPPSPPTKITSISGLISYFTNTQIVGLTNGTLYLKYGFWQMTAHEPMMHYYNEGVVLLKSTNFGTDWTFADTLDHNGFAIGQLQITSTSTLVYVYVDNSNLYIKSSLDGRSWSAPQRINPTENTATAKWNFGISTALIDDNNIGVAWIDTTTGYDEIFYRKMSIPTPPAVGVAERNNLKPTQFSLYQNYPNPFNPTTVISYQLSVHSNVKLCVYDILGKEIATLVNHQQEAGNYSVQFDGSHLASGIYLYKLTAGNFTAVKKLTLMK